MYTQNTSLVYDLLGFKYLDPSPSWATAERYYNCDKFQRSMLRIHKKLKLFRR